MKVQGAARTCRHFTPMHDTPSEAFSLPLRIRVQAHGASSRMTMETIVYKGLPGRNTGRAQTPYAWGVFSIDRRDALLPNADGRAKRVEVNGHPP